MFRLFSLAALIAVFISSALAVRFPGRSALLHKREDIAPGSPLYECHLDCGEVILMSEDSGYCDNSNFTTYLTGCLDCAVSEGIWQYYGSEVKAAAEACGDDDTPVSSSAAASATATATGTAATAATATATGASTATASGASASSTSTSTSGASGLKQNAVLVALTGAFVWALSA
ncbi:hypothetical protein ASPZODRAFT_146094 [Penicilliopsis zonata CBS 506.65]|uniref:Uncharacterized protein n=1 Tax=Penicilliopsis zonata CBS 506.65 TaxID=1073090 RepID=A0A1L9S893_9EURO|nr:hypothetical protein ASPZODRAFT_146094 [Penicilliopsis zonata CBS 506.65]OJJ43379.1 hypothetical protein ASPZODRAFT_146094 [Penicilliopsis zonata CBS 506.65]